MNYEIFIPAPIEKRLEKLTKEYQRRFFTKVAKLQENPQIGKPLRKPLQGYWELYFERSFRILYTIEYDQKKVIIEAIKHKDEF